MRIVVIDGMGGGLSAQIVANICHKLPEGCELIGLGTNALATAALLKAGVQRGATGENAICFTVKTADIIVGPVGIIIPNAMLGEISPSMATAIATAPGKKILLPVKQNHFEFVGVDTSQLSLMLKAASDRVLELAKK